MKILFRNEDMVVEYSDGVRRMWIKKVCQGQVSNTSLTPVSAYMIKIMSAIKDPKSILFVGLGAGILPTYYHKKGVEVEVIEPRIDVIHAAKTYFRFPAKDIMTYLGLAENMIEFTGKYDHIVLDAYDGDVAPPGIYNDEFMKVLKTHLNPGGSVVINVLDEGKNVVYEVKSEEVPLGTL